MSKIGRIFRLVIVGFTVFVCTSCNKDDDNILTIPDVSLPVVSVTTPAKFSTVTSQAPIHVIGTVTDNASLNTLHIKVLNLKDSSVVLDVKPVVNGKKGYLFNESFGMNTSGAFIPCALLISCSDKSGNVALEQTNFVVN